MSPTYDADDDTPRTYAASLVSALAEVKRIDASPFDPDESELPGDGVLIKNNVTDAMDMPAGATRITREGDLQIITFPNATRSDLEHPVAENVFLRLAYRPDGRVKVIEASYSNKNDNRNRILYAGYIDEFDVGRAFEAGIDSAKHLFKDYVKTGLSPTQSLDFGVTVGLGYPFHSWTMHRDIGYEGGRKNRAEARDALRDAGWDNELTERDSYVARCGVCSRNMQSAESCDEERTLVNEDGEEYEPVRYGDERKYTDEEFREKVFDADVRPGTEPDGRCNDCGVTAGHVHHEGCDWEECPQCGLQLLSCDCDWVDLSRTLPDSGNLERLRWH